MENIWSFLLQTLSVSLIGLLLLVVKLLLRNRLSPRWQYAVWGVLAVRLMVPASTYGKDIFLPLPLWVETVKLTVEQGLSSAYTAFYEAVRVVAPVPWLSGGPVSVTDWLFLLWRLWDAGMGTVRVPPASPAISKRGTGFCTGVPAAAANGGAGREDNLCRGIPSAADIPYGLWCFPPCFGSAGEQTRGGDGNSPCVSLSNSLEYPAKWVLAGLPGAPLV